MAEPKQVTVELSALLQDLEPESLKGGIAAPLAQKAARLAKLAREQNPELGTVKPVDVISALLHAAELTDETLGQVVSGYRRARAWQLREELGEATAREGPWVVELPNRGQSYT